MKIIFYILLLASITICLPAQTLIKKEVIPYDETYSGFGIPSSLFKYFHYGFEKNKIIKIDEHSRTVIHEYDEFYLFSIDYYSDANKLLYTYGHPNVSVPAIYDLKNHSIFVLKNLFLDDIGNKEISSISNPTWISPNEIIYFAYNFITAKKEVYIYNTNNKLRKKIIIEDEISNFNYDKKHRKLIYTVSYKNKNELKILDIDKEEIEQTIEGNYRSVLFLLENMLIAINKETQNIEFIKSGEVVSKVESGFILSFYKYIREDNILITQEYTDTNKKNICLGLYNINFE